MAFTAYTGKLMEVVAGAITLEGLTKVDLDMSDGPDAEQLDKTTVDDAAYAFMTDPLGAKGDDKTTLVATCWASTNGYADSKNTKVALNTEAVTVFDTAKGTANANTLTHNTLQLTQRVTEIGHDSWATQVLTFEANALGTWDSPA